MEFLYMDNMKKLFDSEAFIKKHGADILIKRDVNQEEIDNIINNALDYEALLSKYGPENLYLIADKLKEIADNDVSLALKEGKSCYLI